MAEEIEIGSIYRINLDEKDDVTPKGGLEFRPKFFIVIGSAEYGYYIAYVLINKSINTKFLYTKALLNHQYPLHIKDYPEIFDIEPSYANLARIREIDRDRLLFEASYQGKLTERDFTLVMETLRNSDVITTKEKKRYGLIK